MLPEYVLNLAFLTVFESPTFLSKFRYRWTHPETAFSQAIQRRPLPTQFHHILTYLQTNPLNCEIWLTQPFSRPSTRMNRTGQASTIWVYFMAKIHLKSPTPTCVMAPSLRKTILHLPHHLKSQFRTQRFSRIWIPTVVHLCIWYAGEPREIYALKMVSKTVVSLLMSNGWVDIWFFWDLVIIVSPNGRTSISRTITYFNSSRRRAQPKAQRVVHVSFSQGKKVYVHLIHSDICKRSIVPHCYGWSILSRSDFQNYHALPVTQDDPDILLG